MKAVFVGEHPDTGDTRKGIFLAGPSPRGGKGRNWRPDALESLEQQGFDGLVYVPLLEDGSWLGNFEMQMDWELHYLEIADIIAFWVPRDLETLPGLTTNIEFGLFVKSGKVVLGYPSNATHVRYMDRLARLHHVLVTHDFEHTLYLAMMLAKEKE